MSKQESSINNCSVRRETAFGDNEYEKVESGNNSSLTTTPGNISSSSSLTTSVTTKQEDILQNISSGNSESITLKPSHMLLLLNPTTNYISNTDTSDTINESNDANSSQPESTITQTSLLNKETAKLQVKVESNGKQCLAPHTIQKNEVSSNSTKVVNNTNNNKNTKTLYKSAATETNQVKITLMDEKLWDKFHSHVNEMIVTKDGRRMFPVLKIKIDGLDPSSMYTVTIDFSVSDGHRWKFMNGRWIRGNKEDNIKNSSTYMHCDSPNFGSFWMNNTVSFAKLKISNKVSKDPSKIQIHSLFRYLPCIHVYSIDSTTRGLSHVITKHFDNSEFVAVTAYQNDAITRLKVSYNPFAKAFLDLKRTGGNDSPSSSYNSSGGSHCHNRDIYKPYDNNYFKTFNTSTSSSSIVNNNNNNNNNCATISNSNNPMSAYHKQFGNVTTDDSSCTNLSSNVNPFFYQHNLSQESSTSALPSPAHSVGIARHLRHTCNPNTSTNTTTTINSSTGPASTGGNNNMNELISNSCGIINPTNLPHYYDYLQSTSENCSINSRINMEARNNSLLPFYDDDDNNNNNIKTSNYPYSYQYNCPNNFYYDKAYLPAESSYFYSVKTENTTPQSLTPSSHTNQQNNSGNISVCGANRAPPIHQYSNYNYQNMPLFYNKDNKYHEKSVNPKSGHPSQTGRGDDKRAIDP